MNFSLSFTEHDVAVNEDTWNTLATTGSDIALANIRATIEGVLERGGVFAVEDANDQVVRRFETASAFQGFMQEMDMQRKQFQQEQA